MRGQINNPLSLNLYTYVMNNPLTRWDPNGHDTTDQAAQQYWGSYWGQVKAYVQDKWYSMIDSEVYKGTKAVADFLILDDIDILLDPDASIADKSLAGLGFVPGEKVFKGGMIVLSLAKKYKKIERAGRYKWSSE